MEELSGLTLEQAYDKLVETNNKIDLKRTLLTTNENPVKTNKLRDIVTSGGRINNDHFLSLIIVGDTETKELRNLYIKKIAYEKYILDEINRLELSDPTIAIVFLKDYLKLNWMVIAKKLYEYYSERQIRKYYYDYHKKIKLMNIVYSKNQKKSVVK